MRTGHAASRLAIIPVLALAVTAACQRTEPEQTESRVGARDDQTEESKPPEPDELSPSEAPELPEHAEPEDEPAAAEPGPPPHYGQIRPSLPPPPEETLTHQGLAEYEVVAIYDRPDMESPKLGYLRIGTRLPVTPKIEGPDCKKGWYGLPQGGFVCASKGFTAAEDPPPLYRPPPPPRVDQPFPYDWAKVRRWNAPMWWRIPNAAEITEANAQREIREADRQGLPPPGSEPTPTGDTGAREAASPDDAPDDAVAAKPPPPPPKPEKPAITLPLKPSDAWMDRGFYVSLGEKIQANNRNWWKTARGGFVSASDIVTYSPKDFSGQALPDETGFPFGFVWRNEGTKLFELVSDKKLRGAGTLRHRSFVALTEETRVGGVDYMTTPEGLLVRKDHLRLAEPQPVPQGLEPWEKWIDVSLEQQMLVAYEGDRPVYATLVSTGRKGTPDKPSETPTGRWRIRTKHITSTMDDTASDDRYSIQDVPWVMFFEGSYALHGAFWHDGFGRVRSHGCVNLGSTDARWLFYWTTPHLPETWHGVFSQETSPGTMVVVRP